jgi:hypothetical protein
VKEVAAMAQLITRDALHDEARLGTHTPVTSADEVVTVGSGDLDTAGGIVRFTFGRSRAATIFAAGIARFPLGSPPN